MKLPLAALFLAALVVPAHAQDPPENLLRDAGMEAGSRRPDEWARGNPVPGVEYVWDDTVAAEGRRSLGLHKSVARYFPIADWTQTVEHDGTPGKVHFGALVKAEAARKAILDVQFRDGAGEWTHAWAAYVGARSRDADPADHDWRWTSGVVAVPEGTVELTFGLQIYGPGKVWFDRALATFVEASTPATDPLAVRPRPADAWGQLPPLAAAESAGAGDEDSIEPIAIDGDANRRYFLNESGGDDPEDGRALLVVLPGGDGSADFQPFVSRIAERALPEGWLLAQAIAPVWRADDDRVVWPTKRLPDDEMEFPTEDFLRAIVADVAERREVDPDRVFLLGWSSGGPACYAAAIEKDSPFRGAFVAMSVFKQDLLGSLRHARGRSFYVLHSPEDFISMDFPERAVKELGRARARVVLETYAGGHGWRGDVFGTIARGVKWLEEEEE